MKWLVWAVVFSVLALTLRHQLWVGLTVISLILFLWDTWLRPGPRRSSPEKASPEESPAIAAENPVVLPVEDSIDLHTFLPSDVVDAAHEYLFTAAEAGFREVRLIHGRGIGWQRKQIRAMLPTHPLVESFADAPPERGGWGATVVRLKHSVSEA